MERFKSISKLKVVDVWTFMRRKYLFLLVVCNYMVLVYDRVVASCSTYDLTYYRQVISATVCVKRFTDRHALTYLQSPRSEKIEKKRFSYGNA